MDLLSGTVFLAKNYLQVAIIKIKSATIAFFFALFLLSLIFLRYYDFGASRA